MCASGTMIKLATIWPVWPDNCLLTIAEQTGYEYSGFWIIIPGKHFHLVLAVALNLCWGSCTVRALSCPQPCYLLPLELVDLVRLVPLLVKAIWMLSGLQPFFCRLVSLQGLSVSSSQLVSTYACPGVTAELK